MSNVLSSSTVMDMTNNTTFRALATELNGWLSGVGLVQTTDTGQMNLTTVTVPGTTTTIIGYEIWRFADSSIYFKLEWWTQSATAGRPPQFFLTVGQGSDGSGNITGTTSTRSSINTAASANANIATPFPTYISRDANSDFFGICWKIGGSNLRTSMLSFAIEKYCDTTGAGIGDGFVVTYQGAGTTAVAVKQSVRTATTTTVWAASASFCAVPGNITDSSTSATERQNFLHCHTSPRGIYSNFLSTVLVSELPVTTTYNTTLVGSTTRGYMSVGVALGCGNSSSASAAYGIAMLWEP